MTGAAPPLAHSDPMSQVTTGQTLLLEIARPKIFFAVRLTPTGILAIGALTSGILLDTRMLVSSAVR